MVDVPTSRHPRTRALLRMKPPPARELSDRRLFRLVPSLDAGSARSLNRGEKLTSAAQADRVAGLLHVDRKCLADRLSERIGLAGAERAGDPDIAGGRVVDQDVRAAVTVHLGDGVGEPHVVE